MIICVIIYTDTILLQWQSECGGDYQQALLVLIGDAWKSTKSIEFMSYVLFLCPVLGLKSTLLLWFYTIQT